MAGNLLWLAVSLLLASGVWYIAVTSADPIGKKSFRSIPVQIVPSKTAEMTNSRTRSATVTIQGLQTTISARRAEDIMVRADLSRLGPGTHTVPLEVNVAQPDADSFRRLVSLVQPSQIIVELEPLESHEKKITIELLQAPPIGFRHDAPLPNITEVLVSGAASRVGQVVAARGELDLSTSRNPIEVDLRLYAVDADGNRVNDLELNPQTATVSVNIARRDDIRQIAVRPNVLLDTLPAGFTLKNQSYDPESIFVSGAPEQLGNISDTLFTEPIGLERRQEGFVTTVPVHLPGDDLFVMSGDNNVTVSIEIIPIIDSRQIDNIEVAHIGLESGYSVSIVPKAVSAIVTGPVVMVDVLTVENIQVVVDLNGLSPGVYDREPSISINQGELDEESVSLLPDVVNVEITLSQDETGGAEETPETSPVNG
jgi:YbbR domain-containing protein